LANKTVHESIGGMVEQLLLFAVKTLVDYKRRWARDDNL
jgi:hypothetical protein